ncbi:MAG TPA: fluoride efflux transporter CrcB [Longimicrobium sp.]|nr:fluoride efflux transporter CrcB [Longimicrobium sp.]
MILLYLAAGGIAGTWARHGVGRWVQASAGDGFPWGTFVVNLLGSFLLGFLIRAMEGASVSPETRAMLTVGFCGAFTTFSTFTHETVVLLQEGAWARAAAYALGSLLLGLAALAAGLGTAGLLVGAKG